MSTFLERNAWMAGFLRGDDAFVVGCGPSLTGFDFGRLKGKRVIACKRAYFDCLSAGVQPEVFCFVDATYKSELANRWRVDPYSMPCRVVAGPSTTFSSRGSVYVYNDSPNAVSKRPDSLFSSRHTGLAAINLAHIGQARRIILLGIDLKFQGDRSHYHSAPTDPHKHDKRNLYEYLYDGMVKSYEKFAEHTDAIRVVGDSALGKYQRISLDEALPPADPKA